MQKGKGKKSEPRKMTAMQRNKKNARDRARRAEIKALEKKLSAPDGVVETPADSATHNEKVSAGKDLRVREVFKKVSEDPSKSVGQAMREIGYSDTTSAIPTIVTNTDLWRDLLDKYLPNTLAMETHTNLLKASRVDHMTFIAAQEGILDADINEMFQEIGCKVRKIIHRDNGARDVYFFMPDNKARAAALDMLYKLRTAYGADKAAAAFSLAKLAAMRDAPETPLEDNARNTPRLPRTA